MKTFFRACRQRPLFLWILLFIWLIACSALCAFLFDKTHDLLSFLPYLLLPFPICHLALFEKPMRICDYIVLGFTYLGIFNVISRFIWLNIPDWVTFSGMIVCASVIVGVTFRTTK